MVLFTAHTFGHLLYFGQSGFAQMEDLQEIGRNASALKLKPLKHTLKGPTYLDGEDLPKP